MSDEIRLDDSFVREVLARTSGSACFGALPRLVGFADGELAAVDTDLVRLHVSDCTDCALLVGVLRSMSSDLPALASIEPDPRFAREVMARLRPRPGFAAQGAAWVAALFERPRIAWEAAYVLTAVLSLAFVFPGSPLSRVPERARELARLEAGVEVTAPVARLWQATATEADLAWSNVAANLSRGFGTLRGGDASEREKAETKGD